MRAPWPAVSMSREAHRHDGRGHLNPFSRIAQRARNPCVVSRGLHVAWSGTVHICRPRWSISVHRTDGTVRVAPATMRPTALALNILVSTFTSARFLNAGLFPLARALAIRARSHSVRLPRRLDAMARRILPPACRWGVAVKRSSLALAARTQVEHRSTRPTVWAGIICGVVSFSYPV